MRTGRAFAFRTGARAAAPPTEKGRGGPRRTEPSPPARPEARTLFRRTRHRFRTLPAAGTVSSGPVRSRGRGEKPEAGREARVRTRSRGPNEDPTHARPTDPRKHPFRSVAHTPSGPPRPAPAGPRARPLRAAVSAPSGPLRREDPASGARPTAPDG
ncbi:hypothetical protein SCA03_19090 [Streptomyces cacaoi]|uniref:Uncharacterized protein n=1 Tax=Streptomyces cacaoi TaxID=1898 RepID=A0A4Y3QY34_STRCI|nr:hypothetical protein SCA03_19090 [Streptomyces cacaoi]